MGMKKYLISWSACGVEENDIIWDWSYERAEQSAMDYAFNAIEFYIGQKILTPMKYAEENPLFDEVFSEEHYEQYEEDYVEQYDNYLDDNITYSAVLFDETNEEHLEIQFNLYGSTPPLNPFSEEWDKANAGKCVKYLNLLIR